MAGRTWHILALSAIALFFLFLAAQAEAPRMVDAGEILKKIELGQPVDYQKVIVTGDLDLNSIAEPPLSAQRTAQKSSAGRTVVTSPIRINDSIILNDINFHSAILENITDFQGTKFRSRVSMRDSRFNDIVNFNKAEFGAAADFSLSQFGQPASFSGAKFTQTAYFREAKFGQEARFGSAQFNQTVDFTGAQFEKAGFFAVQFSQYALFREGQIQPDCRL